MITTPGQVLAELASIRQQSEKGIELLASTEQELVLAELAADRIEAQAVLDYKGTVADKQALAFLAAFEAKEKAALLRVQVNRIKMKLKHLSESMNAVQTSARMVELEWRVGGTGR